jgi:hypothetical protein
LLHIFKEDHSEGNLGAELTNLFKQWCIYPKCREIFTSDFVPFVMQIVEQYYSSTPNEDNKDKQLTLGNSTGTSENLSGTSLDSSNEKLKLTQPEKVVSVVDASILMHVLEFVCVLLKNTPTDT